jgi:ribosomal protein S8
LHLTNEKRTKIKKLKRNLNGPQIETMQDMWDVLREDGQVSYLQGPLPAKLVSLGILILLSSHGVFVHHEDGRNSFHLTCHLLKPTEVENHIKI